MSQALLWLVVCITLQHWREDDKTRTNPDQSAEIVPSVKASAWDCFACLTVLLPLQNTWPNFINVRVYRGLLKFSFVALDTVSWHLSSSCRSNSSSRNNPEGEVKDNLNLLLRTTSRFNLFRQFNLPYLLLKMGMESSCKYNGTIVDQQLGFFSEILALSVVMNLLRITYEERHYTEHDREVPQTGH